MKLFKNLLIASVLFFGAVSMNAQSKIAHINTDELVAAMPETKKMQEELKKLVQTYDTEFKTQSTSLQQKMQKYQQEAPTQTDAENQKRDKKLMNCKENCKCTDRPHKKSYKRKSWTCTSP